ncbi:hypothetical protein ACFQE1_07525 [Halobium palmae]|uniref:Uncharacterized protein n=1 Tax=Halobium palmae TaxID=1776492 RepID=A0ABD5RXR8_9EURY
MTGGASLLDLVGVFDGAQAEELHEAVTAADEADRDETEAVAERFE